MLQYMPIYGSILLTIIIVWIVASTIVGNRRKIGQALDGAYIRSTCCGATTTPIGWTEEGWTSRCDACGEWQYLGDDHDNPPPGFQADGRPIPTLILSVDDQISPSLRAASERMQGFASGGFVRQESNPGSDGWDRFRQAFDPEVTSEDAPLVMPPQPNIGGEGHPDYAGPHYEVEHDQFVPYDMLADPIPGTAVHKVGDVAFAGPLPDDDDKGKGDAEDDNRSS